MIATAKLRFIRITPRKFRQIVPLVKGRSPEHAIAILMGTKKRASSYAVALIKAAVANAKVKNRALDLSTLIISKLVADCGPQLKRFRAGSMGRASTIRKRTCHITLELDQLNISSGKENDAGPERKEHTEGPKTAKHPSKEGNKQKPRETVKSKPHKK